MEAAGRSCRDWVSDSTYHPREDTCWLLELLEGDIDDLPALSTRDFLHIRARSHANWVRCLWGLNIIRERITEHVSSSERVVGLQRKRIVGVHAIFLAASLHAHVFDQIGLGHPSACVKAFVDLVSFAVKGLDGEFPRLSRCSWIYRAS